MRTTAEALGDIRVLDLMWGIAGPIRMLPTDVFGLVDGQDPARPGPDDRVLDAASFDTSEVADLLARDIAYGPGPGCTRPA